MKRAKNEETERFFWWRCNKCRVRFQSNIDDSKKIIENYYCDEGYFLCHVCINSKK